MASIRIHNTTGADLEDVRVYVPTSTEPVAFGPLSNDSYSEYREVPDARRIAHIEATGPSGDFLLQPYDYVGEGTLPPGRFTYRLGTTQGRPILDVEVDARDDE